MDGDLDPELVALRRLLGYAAGVTITLPCEPLDYQRRLLEALGARWRVVNARTTESERRPDGSLTMSELNRRHQEAPDAQPAVFRCGLDGCGWKFEGPSGEGREAARAHRETAHPQLATKAGRAELARKAAEERAAALAEAEARRLARAAQDNGLAALEAMDAGERQREETDAFEEVVPTVERVQPDASEETGPAEVGRAGGARHEFAVGGDRRVGGASTTDPFQQRRRRRTPWADEEVFAAFRRFHEEHGRAPLPSDVKTCGYLPGDYFGKRRTEGLRTWQDVWTHLGWGKVPTGQGARKYRGLPATGGPTSTRSGPVAGTPTPRRAGPGHEPAAGPDETPSGAETAAGSTEQADRTPKADSAGTDSAHDALIEDVMVEPEPPYEPPTLVEGLLQLLDAVRGGLDALNVIVDAAERALNEHAAGDGPIRIRIGGAG